MGCRTLDNMLRSGRFALIGAGARLEGTLSAPEPIEAGSAPGTGSQLAPPLSPIEAGSAPGTGSQLAPPLSPISEGAFPPSQTWPPDARSPRSPGAALSYRWDRAFDIAFKGLLHLPGQLT